MLLDPADVVPDMLGLEELRRTRFARRGKKGEEMSEASIPITDDGTWRHLATGQKSSQLSGTGPHPFVDAVPEPGGEVNGSNARRIFWKGNDKESGTVVATSGTAAAKRFLPFMRWMSG